MKHFITMQFLLEDSKAILEHLKNFKARPMFDKDEYMYVNDVLIIQLLIKENHLMLCNMNQEEITTSYVKKEI